MKDVKFVKKKKLIKYIQLKSQISKIKVRISCFFIIYLQIFKFSQPYSKILKASSQ